MSWTLDRIRQTVFLRADWAPEQSDNAVYKLTTLVNLAMYRVLEDFPGVFFQDEVRLIAEPDVDMETNGYEGAHVIVEINYDATPTDEVKIKLYGSLDGSNYDDTPVWEMQGDKSVDPQQLSFVIKDLAHFRIGVQQTGSTDSHDVRAYVQCWNYQSV